jgi:hypothetical protein
MKCYLGVKGNEILILTRLKDMDGRRMEDFHYTVKPGERFYGLSYDQLRAYGNGEMEIDQIPYPRH